MLAILDLSHVGFPFRGPSMTSACGTGFSLPPLLKTQPTILMISQGFDTACSLTKQCCNRRKHQDLLKGSFSRLQQQS